MPVLYCASLGYLRRHPWQLGLAVLGICIGVAVMVAVDLANQSSRKAFLLSMDAVTGRATHQVVAGPGGVDEALYKRLRVDLGLRNIAPVVSGYVQAGDRTLRLLGIDVFAEREFRPFAAPPDVAFDLAGQPGGASLAPETMIRRLLGAAGSVFMSRETAEQLGVGPGESFEVLADGRSHVATLAGVLNGEDSRRLGDLVIADIAVAQQWLGMQGRLSRIDVRLSPGEAPTAADLRAVLPAGNELLSAKGRSRTTVDMSNAFMTNLTAMSLLALLVGFSSSTTVSLFPYCSVVA